MKVIPEKKPLNREQQRAALVSKYNRVKIRKRVLKGGKSLFQQMESLKNFRSPQYA